jgi:hypothetical protein
MFKTILFELKSLIQNLKRNFLQPTLDFGPVIFAAHPTFFLCFLSAPAQVAFSPPGHFGPWSTWCPSSSFGR